VTGPTTSNQAPETMKNMLVTIPNMAMYKPEIWPKIKIVDPVISIRYNTAPAIARGGLYVIE